MKDTSFRELPGHLGEARWTRRGLKSRVGRRLRARNRVVSDGRCPAEMIWGSGNRGTEVRGTRGKLSGHRTLHYRLELP